MKTLIYPQSDGSVRLDETDETGSVLSSTTYPEGCYEAGEGLVGWAKKQRPSSESVEIAKVPKEEIEAPAPADEPTDAPAEDTKKRKGKKS